MKNFPLKKILLPQIPFFILLIYVLVVRFLYNYDFMGFSDAPGHITQSVSSLANLDGSVYNFKALMGFYPILYPPIVPFIYSILKSFLDASFAWFLIFFITIPLFNLGVYKICKYFKVSYFVFVFITTVCISTSFQHENKVFYTASNAAFLGFALYIWIIYFYLKFGIQKRTIPLFALLTTLTILTHTITASVLIIFYGIIFFKNLYNKNFIQISYLVLIGLISFISSLLWIIPYIEFKNVIVQEGIRGYWQQIYTFSFILMGLATLWKAKILLDLNLNKRLLVLVILAITTLVIGLIPDFGILKGIHYYRYFMYGVLLAVPIIFSSSEIIDKIKSIAISSSLILLFVFSIEVYNLKVVPYVIFKQLPRELNIEGRVMDLTYPASNHTFYSELISKYNVSSLNGLYKQGSPMYLLIRSISQSYSDFIANEDFFSEEEYDKAFKATSNLLDLAGINYFLVPDAQIKAEDKKQLEKENRIFYFAETGDGIKKYDAENENKAKIYLVKRKQTSDIVEILKTSPKIVEPGNAGEFNFDTLNLDNLYTYDTSLKEYYEKADLKDIHQKAKVTNIDTTSSSISFLLTNDSQLEYVPVIIKTGYSKYLKAFYLDNNEEIQTHDISPNLTLLLVREGAVIIEPYAPSHFLIAWFISLTGLIILISANLYLIFKQKYPKID